MLDLIFSLCALKRNSQDRIKALLAQATQMQNELDVERAAAGIKREASPIRVPDRSTRKRVFIDLTLE